MKVLAINGSPRRQGNTGILVNAVCGELEREGIETEQITIGHLPLRGCLACERCREPGGKGCVIPDELNAWLDKIEAAHGLILASPVYTGDVSAAMKAFIERAAHVMRAPLVRGEGHSILWRKVAVPLVTMRRVGAAHTLGSLMNLLTHNETIVPFAGEWPVGIGKHAGSVLDDAAALEDMKNLGKTMVWTLKRLYGSRLDEQSAS